MIHLTKKQRHTIYVLKKENYSNKKIAKAIGKSESTISRELRRSSTKIGKCSADYARESYEIRNERFHLTRKFTVEKKRIVDKKFDSVKK